MSTKLKASLEDAIQAWCDRECELDTWPPGMYWPDGMTARMAEAAYNILMANKEAQDFAKEQNK